MIPRTAACPPRITDALVLRARADLTDDAPADRGELVRSVAVLAGSARINVRVEPRGGARAYPAFSGLEVRASSGPDLRLHLRANRPLKGCGASPRSQGETGWISCFRGDAFTAMLRQTVEAWRRWMHPTNPLFQLHDVIVTPQAAYYSEESIGAVRRIAAEEAVRG